MDRRASLPTVRENASLFGLYRFCETLSKLSNLLFYVEEPARVRRNWGDNAVNVDHKKRNGREKNRKEGCTGR